ncbi:MAG: hypothetical protein GTO23_08505, partial [Nitrososphaeria archaeon]|nr:hypothetical protein [Nitrososphaeria archaeon]
MRLPSLVFDKDISSNFKQYLLKEWIITNGLGGYASSTVLGINTRKYHGLLVASVDRASGRKVCMAKLDEEMNIGKNIYPLSASEFQNGIFPKGYMFLKSFSVSPFPKYTYSVEEVELRKTIFMPCEKNVAIVLYEVLNQSDFGIELRIFPLVNWRHYHSVIDRWKDPWKLTEEQKENLLRMDFGDGSLSIVSTRGDFSADGKWVEKVFYREEEKRGESSLDDYYQPGNFSVHVRARENVRFALTATAQSRKPSGPSVLSETPIAMYDIDALYEKERKRRTDLLNRFYREHRDIHVKEWLNWMILATDTFIIRGFDPRESSVVAGYHWFEAWGRDAFISLPGLLLVARRFEDAR